MAHIYCPECGFQNPEAANYCSKCGALLHAPEPVEQTQAFSADESDPYDTLDLELKGPALVVRAPAARAGESFQPRGERTLIGRSPDCVVFLDDVTVSRRHALIVRAGGAFTIADQGSLNGTYVNRHRVEHAHLADGDEVQIGKYRLTFIDNFVEG